MCFQKIREGGRKGDVILGKGFGEDDGGWQRGCKNSKLGVHSPIYLNMTLSYRNSLTKTTQLFIYFRKKGKHVNFLVMAA